MDEASFETSKTCLKDFLSLMKDAFLDLNNNNVQATTKFEDALQLLKKFQEVILFCETEETEK